MAGCLVDTPCVWPSTSACIVRLTSSPKTVAARRGPRRKNAILVRQLVYNTTWTWIADHCDTVVSARIWLCLYWFDHQWVFLTPPICAPPDPILQNESGNGQAYCIA